MGVLRRSQLRQIGYQQQWFCAMGVGTGFQIQSERGDGEINLILTVHWAIQRLLCRLVNLLHRRPPQGRRVLPVHGLPDVSRV